MSRVRSPSPAPDFARVAVRSLSRRSAWRKAGQQTRASSGQATLRLRETRASFGRASQQPRKQRLPRHSVANAGAHYYFPSEYLKGSRHARRGRACRDVTALVLPPGLAALGPVPLHALGHLLALRGRHLPATPWLRGGRRSGLRWLPSCAWLASAPRGSEIGESREDRSPLRLDLLEARLRSKSYKAPQGFGVQFVGHVLLLKKQVTQELPYPMSSPMQKARKILSDVGGVLFQCWYRSRDDHAKSKRLLIDGWLIAHNQLTAFM